ncbi:MAG: hypothetical protein JWN04_4157 [Myxococcaceae bacterium]|nr:hypothetical protein [Myxococcaceae bacterium]
MALLTRPTCLLFIVLAFVASPGAGVAQVAPPAFPEAPSNAEPALPATAPTPLVLAVPPARSERLRELSAERERLHVGRKITFAAISAGVALAGVSLLFESLALHLEGCHSGSSGGLHSPFRNCTARDAAFPVAMTGAGFVVVGGVLLGVSLPRMFSTLRRNKELGRELKALRSTQLSLGGPAGPFGLSLRGSF